MKTVFLRLKKSFLLFALFSCFQVLFNSCSAKEEQTVASVEVAALESAPPMTDQVSFSPPERQEEMQESPPPPPFPAEPGQTDQTKIIRKASVRFQVGDYQQAFKAIETRIKQFQGIIISTNETREDNSLQNSIRIKVPAGNLDNLLNALTRQAVFIDYKNITAEDVSLEYVDVSARMKAKKAVELRYLDLLRQAKTVEDMIEIENQLLQIREEIESSQARLNYINNHVAYSTVSLEIYDNKSVTEDTNTFGIRIVNALKTGWESLLEFMFSIVTLWPLLIILPVVFLLIRKLLRKFRAPKP